MFLNKTKKCRIKIATKVVTTESIFHEGNSALIQQAMTVPCMQAEIPLRATLGRPVQYQQLKLLSVVRRRNKMTKLLTSIFIRDIVINDARNAEYNF